MLAIRPAREAPLIQTGPYRDLRIDFFRGVALWWIFADHIPDNWVGMVSLRNFALCDATEVFVLLAGYAAAIAYGRTYERDGWLFAGADVMRRAWTLYIAHIFLFVVFSAQVSYSATALDRADYLDEIHLDVFADAPYRAMLQALLLNFQPAYLNILPMYIALLAFFAALLPLLSRPWVMFGVSITLYTAARIFGWNLPSWTDGGWYFNPLCWQLLFVLGAIMSRRSLRPPVPTWMVDAAAGLMIATGVAIVWLVWPSDDVIAHVPRSIVRTVLTVDKEGMHPMRVLSILALTWGVVRLVPFGARWLRSRWAMPFIVCGQHSLPVFCCSIALSFMGRLVMEQEGGWVGQVVVNITGPLALFGVGALAAWYRSKSNRHRASPSPRPLPEATPAENLVQPLREVSHAGNAKVI
jgi:hypothetical protein